MDMPEATAPGRSASTAAIVFAGAYLGVQMVSNIASLKVGAIAGLAVDLGTFLYPLSFTLRDAVHRTLGKKGTQIVVFTAAGLCLAMSLYLSLCTRIPAAPECGEAMDRAFSLVFSPVWRIVVFSILAGTLSELLDTEVYQKAAYGKKPLNRYLASFLSNLASIPVDTFLFAFGAFAFALPWGAVWQIFFFNLAVKAVVSAIGIPLLGLAPAGR